MTLLTPPPSAIKANKFMDPNNKFTYYEDIYGRRNEDEDFDRSPDQCEDEIEEATDQNGGSRVQLGFFEKFAEPKKMENVAPWSKSRIHL